MSGQPARTAVYTATQKSLHWFVFLLVIGLYGITYLEAFFPRDDPGRDTVWWLHISFGLLFVALVLWRIVARVALGRLGLG